MAHILLADDDVDMQEIFSRFVILWGHTIAIATNAADAVAAAEKEKPDLIFVDLRMPVSVGGDVSDRAGIDATAAIKRIESLQKIPIIALTGHAMTNQRALILEAGCTQLLTKPIQKYKVFREILEATLREAQGS